MSRRAPPTWHWRSYGDETLPTGAEALDEPFSAFPSWFLRIDLRPVRQGADHQRGARRAGELDDLRIVKR
jgi:hypothetical protein